MSFLLIAGMLLMLSGCTEERKREAARLAAELEAKERGETLATDPAGGENAPETLIVNDDTIAIPQDDSAATVDSVVSVIQSTLQKQQATSDSIPPPAIKAMPPMMRDGFSVQVESSPSQGYIMQQLQTFTDRGYDAYLGTVTIEGKTYYRLRIGKYADRNEAARVSEEINSMFNLKSWVDKASW
ncbi:MAG: SPOR domain-containing protein [candidate division Zixibacteria bacterium]|nr:SPOR domain-containing protein [candidate division Zixibacteria bacterium]